MNALVLSALVALLPIPTSSSATQHSDAQLYRILLLRAAPGSVLDVIALEKQASGRPFLLRHSQGDQWDLMAIFPMATDRVTPVEDARLDSALSARIAWREEVFVKGPPLPQVTAALGGGAFYHIEMHVALPGRLADLVREREMENAFERALTRPEDLIFTRVAGATWDVVTVGAYRDIKHYAESADIPEARQDSAARVAGFASAEAIGPYLRTLIATHHDTLARAVH
ncbi:MAG TPA: hypothetical protein VGV12_06775 [Gemmatimonadales bacterium]|nr:hypothetical protein [Gemmatimonadales bacterium]